ncbi:MAG TPA: TIGR00730 family Rossman fold protein [Polyangiales bacterium]|jgi:hypothetical protein
MDRQRVCVFCGSSSGNNAEYERVARELAEAICARGLGLVYGGAHRGLMGTLADRVLELGGEVIGVIPQRLVDLEVAHRHLSALHVVGSMHERKALMAAEAHAFLALPGGFGTLEELMEVVTWRYLGFHEKPCAVLNAAGYFDRFLDFVQHMAAEGFVRPAQTDNLLVGRSAEHALSLLFDRR